MESATIQDIKLALDANNRQLQLITKLNLIIIILVCVVVLCMWSYTWEVKVNKNDGRKVTTRMPTGTSFNYL
jgi:hypothetical protein